MQTSHARWLIENLNESAFPPLHLITTRDFSGATISREGNPYGREWKKAVVQANKRVMEHAMPQISGGFPLIFQRSATSRVLLTSLCILIL